MVVSDLFTAGMVTTSTTLSWALLLMILHPDVQREPGWGWEGGRGTVPSQLIVATSATSTQTPGLLTGVSDMASTLNMIVRQGSPL